MLLGQLWRACKLWIDGWPHDQIAWSVSRLFPHVQLERLAQTVRSTNPHVAFDEPTSEGSLLVLMLVFDDAAAVTSVPIMTDARGGQWRLGTVDPLAHPVACVFYCLHAPQGVLELTMTPDLPVRQYTLIEFERQVSDV